MSESVEQKLKHLMRKAWRERWTDLMWGVYVKEVFTSSRFLYDGKNVLFLTTTDRSYLLDQLETLITWQNVS